MHWLIGFTNSANPQIVAGFIDLRSQRTDLADWIGKKSIRKSEAINRFLELEAIERRKLMMSKRELIPLLPKDVKLLLDAKKVPEDLNAVSSRTFNPGKRIEFDVYSVFEVLGKLTISLAS